MRKELSVRDLLSAHVLRFLRKNKIRELKDFNRVEGIYSAESFQPLEKKLGKLPFVRSVRFDFSRHSYASSYFTIQFRDQALGGMSIHVSHIAPVFHWNFVPREGFGKPISWATPREVWKKIIRDYERAVRRKTPAKAVTGIERVLDEMAAFGWMEIPEKELKRTPSVVAKVPKSLRKYSLAFLYFDCISLSYRPPPRGRKIAQPEK